MVSAQQKHAGFWWRPQQVWVRRALFQIHLWGGLILCVYCVLIGVSGSALVFEDELGQLSYPRLMDTGWERVQVPSLDVIATNVRASAPGWQLETLYTPGVRGANYAAVLQRGSKYEYVFASARDGHVLGKQGTEEGWLNWMADLHFRLLAGSTGLIVNGVGAACLLILCVTGIVIWWPGVRTWKRALTVDFRRRWRRINFDLHSAIGFWTLALMSVWALSGVYFVWPQQFVSAVSSVSKAGNAAPPRFHLKRYGGQLPAVSKFVSITGHDGKLQGILYPSADQPLTLMMTRSAPDDFTHTTYLYFDPFTGDQLGVWRVDANRTMGDWFIWLMAPLHFGTYWGVTVKLVWALIGLMLPVLAVTGLLMYWNRYLSKRVNTSRNFSRLPLST